MDNRIRALNKFAQRSRVFQRAKDQLHGRHVRIDSRAQIRHAPHQQAKLPALAGKRLDEMLAKKPGSTSNGGNGRHQRAN